jgi:hypothetical protein
MTTMTRREALQRLALGLGLSLAGPRLLAATFQPGPPPGFTPQDIALLDEIADTIIPPTDVPGAKAAGTGAFIAMMVHDCYEPAEQTVFRAGIAQLAADYQAKHGTPFVSGKAADRTAFLAALDANRPRYFRMLKDLTLLGYFTSEIGCTQALRYDEVPGRFDGDVPYQPGTPDHADPIS